MLSLKKLTKGILATGIGLSVFAGSFYLDRDGPIVQAAEAKTVIIDTKAGKGEMLTVDGYYPNDNFTRYTMVTIGDTGGKNQESLVKFDVSSIPSTAIIQSAKVTMHMVRNYYSLTPFSVYLYRIAEPWDAKSVTYNTKPKYDTSTFLGTLSPNSTYQFVPQIVNMKEAVSNWVKDSSTNYGFSMTVYPQLVEANARVSFYASEETAPDKVPTLTVTYLENVEPEITAVTEPKETLLNDSLPMSLTVTDKNPADNLDYTVSLGSTKGGNDYASAITIPSSGRLPSNPATLNYAVDTSKIPFSALSWNEASKQFERTVYLKVGIDDNNGGKTFIEKEFLVTEKKPKLNILAPAVTNFKAYESLKIEGNVTKANKNREVDIKFTLSEDTNKDSLPDKAVDALKNKLIKTYTSTGSYENFGTTRELTLEDILPTEHANGQYILSAWAEDENGLKSPIEKFIINLTINDPPTVTFDGTAVDKKIYYADKESPLNEIALKNIKITDGDIKQDLELFISYLDKKKDRQEVSLGKFNSGDGKKAIAVDDMKLTVTDEFFEGDNEMILYAKDVFGLKGNEIKFTPKTLIKQPTVTATPDHVEKQSEAIQVTLGFDDKESGMGDGSITSFLITQFKTPPKSNSTWDDVSAKAEPLDDGKYRLPIEKEGNNYLHIKAVDVAGYERIYTFGPYVVSVDNLAPDLFFTLEDGKTTVPTSKKSLKVDITVDDDTKPLTNIKLYVSTDMRNWLPSIGLNAEKDGTATYQVPIPTGTKKGSPITVFVRAVDEYGNKTIENKSIIYGVAPPTGGNSGPEIGAEIEFGKRTWVHIGGMRFITKEALSGTYQFSSGSNKFSPSESGNIGQYLNTDFLKALEEDLTASDKAYMVDHTWNTGEENGTTDNVRARVGLITATNYKELENVFKVTKNSWTLTPSGSDKVHLATASENDTNLVQATSSHAVHPVIKFMDGLIVEDGKLSYPSIDRVILDKLDRIEGKIDALDAKLFGVKRIYPFNRLISGKVKRSVLMIETAEGMALHVDAGPLGTNLDEDRVTTEDPSDGTVFTVNLEGYNYKDLPSKITVKAFKDLDGNGTIDAKEYGDGKGYLAIGHIYKDEYYFEVADLDKKEK